MKKTLVAALLACLSLPALAAPPGSADGAAVYKKSCASCHGADGKGGTAKAIAGKSAREVAKALESHPAPADKLDLTPDQTAGVGRFVSSLKK